MLIYACVSGHGFGHGSRVAAVLTALHQQRPHWRLVLSTPLAPAFLQLAFGPVPFEQRPCRWDVGVIQADALGADAAATLAALEQLEQRLPAQLEAELAWLRAQREPVLVLGDVAPAAASLAAALDAPLVWMANFGWDAIYRPMGGAFRGWADRALKAYRRGNALIRCPFSMPMDWDVPATAVGLTPGRARFGPEGLRARLQLTAPREQLVLVGFGGLGLALAPQLLQRWPNHHFLVSDAALAAAPNATLIPPDLRPLELMPLCSRLLTKPGYSTFCEALAAGIGVHLVRREGFAEAPVLEEALQRHGWHRLLSREQLEQGDWQLDQPLLQPSAQALPADGADQAAAVILATASRANAAGNR
ncbi:hypothetical protein KUL97_04500 [Synechococcus sp. HK05]|uniref:hypothetical protein n=1 Tax=Synechococcus sp. HK05 TaxID=2725975 RepID=UPI001C382ECA|nr:hypothetical protein [Synechococcus sp. HK05]